MNFPSDTGWVLYAECEVLYDGRASSKLQLGNYLIIFKPDKSLSIHAATLIQPRNYLAGGTSYTYENNILRFRCKNEYIVIGINKTHSLTPLEDWSANRIEICKTERELALKIFYNWHDYLPDVETIHNEYPTHLGPIDVLGRSSTTCHIVEVKRKTISLKDVTQLRRYVEAMESPNWLVEGYVAAPKLSKNAKAYLEKHKLHYVKVDFD